VISPKVTGIFGENMVSYESLGFGWKNEEWCWHRGFRRHCGPIRKFYGSL